MPDPGVSDAISCFPNHRSGLFLCADSATADQLSLKMHTSAACIQRPFAQGEKLAWGAKMMRHKLLIAACYGAALLSGHAFAGGVDRDPTDVSFIYHKGFYGEAYLGRVSPSISGRDTDLFGGAPIGNVADDFIIPSFNVKADITERLAVGFAVNRPYGIDTEYPAGSLALAGTAFDVRSVGFTGLAKFRATDWLSVHGGLRGERFGGSFGIRGLGWGGLNGYTADFVNDFGVGYVLGGAIEIPDTRTRLSVTYNSAISHNLDTAEAFEVAPGVFIPLGNSITNVRTPRSVSVGVNAQITQSTDIFGGVRWVNWDEFRMDTPVLLGATGQGAFELDDTFTYSLGVEHRFNEQWASSIAVVYEPGKRELVSPLLPINGYVGGTAAVSYTFSNMKLTGNISYTRFDDTKPETGTPDVARAFLTDNNAYGVGLKLSFWR